MDCRVRATAMPQAADCPAPASDGFADPSGDDAATVDSGRRQRHGCRRDPIHPRAPLTLRRSPCRRPRCLRYEGRCRPAPRGGGRRHGASSRACGPVRTGPHGEARAGETRPEPVPVSGRRTTPCRPESTPACGGRARRGTCPVRYGRRRPGRSGRRADQRRSRVGSSVPLRRTTQASVMWVNIASAAPSGSRAAIRS